MSSQLRLIDLPLNRLFTWSNMLEDPNLAKLNKFFVLEAWDSKFPLVEIISLHRPTLDHIPRCLNLREGVPHTSKYFRFEKWWLEYREVHDLIKESWSQRTGARDATDNICRNLHRLCRVLCRWERRFREQSRSQNIEALREIDHLEKQDEKRQLTLRENVRLIHLRKTINELYKKEIKWR